VSADLYLGDHLLLRPAVSLAVATAVAAVLLAVLVGTWFRRRPAVSARRRRVLGLLRLAVVLAVVLLLFRPVLLWDGREAVRPTVAVLLDASRSMAVRDAPGPGPAAVPIARTDAVRAAFAAAPADVLAAADVRRFAFGARLRPLDASDVPPPDDPWTDVAGALDDLAAEGGDHLAAVVLISDGRAARPPRANASTPSATDAAARLAAAGARVHTVVVGSATPTAAVRDVTVRDLRAPGRVFKGDRATVRAVVAALGLEGRSVRLVLRVEGREVERRDLALASNLVTEEVVFTPRLEVPGLARLSLEAAPLDGEVTDANNRAAGAVRVVEGGVRVLYLEGAIRPESKYIARALADARQIDLDRRLLVGPQAAAAAPSPRDLDAFDVLVLGDLAASALPPATVARVAERVRAGRLSLLVLGGRHAFGAGGWAATPLADLMPFAIGPDDAVVPGPVAFLPTPAGRRHFILAGSTAGDGGADLLALLPPLPNASGTGPLDPTARVLAASADGRPLLAVREFGTGRTAALTVDATWLWVLAAADPRAPEVHARFWRQLILWLAGRDGPSRDEPWVVTDRFRYVLADRDAPPAVQVAVYVPPVDTPVAPALPRLRLRAPDGSEADVPLRPTAGPDEPAAPASDWRATLRPDRPGEYTLTLTHADRPGSRPFGRAETPFVVEAQDLEAADVLADPDALRAVAAAGGGSFRPLADLPALLRSVAADLRPAYVPAARSLALASGPLFLGVVFLLLGLEWFLRRTWGLA